MASETGHVVDMVKCARCQKEWVELENMLCEPCHDLVDTGIAVAGLQAAIQVLRNRKYETLEYYKVKILSLTEELSKILK